MYMYVVCVCDVSVVVYLCVSVCVEARGLVYSSITLYHFIFETAFRNPNSVVADWLG